jgi:hypothetical protein
VYPKIIPWLPVIALVPFVGALLNGLLGKRLGRTFVTIFGVGAPAVAFSITAALFAAMVFYDRQIVVQGPREAIDRVAQVLDESGARSELQEDAARLDPNPSDLVYLRLRDARDEAQVARDVASIPGVNIGRSRDFGAYAFTADLGSWISFADLDIRFRFLLDRLAVVMCLVITGVGTLIHIYSTRYMEHEDAGGFARYFSYLNLFVGSMLILVLGADLLLLFVGWEGVGLCSYLLIGFHYKDPANAACGSKAFIVNRIGDFGFVLGVLSASCSACWRCSSWRTRPWSGRSARTSRRSTAWRRPARSTRRGSASPASCCSWARPARARRSRCTCGCPTPWPARRPCRR